MTTATLNAPVAAHGSANADAAPDTAPATGAPRVDLYAPIHKALRNLMVDTLLRVGRLDVFDADETERTIGQLGALLGQCEKHLQHENEFVHPALEARAPGTAARIGAEHVEHLACIAALRDDVLQLRAATPDRRMPLALRLYRQLALFVAENFQHMHVEETVHNAALWAHYSDAELRALHGRLMASVPPQDMLDTARWMLPALSPVERAGMLNGVKAEAPPPVFDALVAHIRPHLDAAGWAKLAPAIGAAPQPDLVHVG
jgi:hypothetical protein